MEYSSYIKSEEYVQPLTEQVYELQSEIIRKLADRSSCVIIGRCADYVLRNNPQCINVFICASMEDRIHRIVERYDLSERKAADRIKKIDRERRYYYESHTGQEWGSISSHQILLNVSNNYAGSTLYEVNASYLRLKNAQIAYHFDFPFMKKIKMNNLTLALSGYNLFTITDFKWGDPESRTSSRPSYPLTRSFSLSLKVGF